jgi:hypothetical protein
MAILITGGTGFVGRRLRRTLLRRGQAMIVCTRSTGLPDEQHGSFRTVYQAWNPLSEPLPTQEKISSVDSIRAVINLMGEPVSGRWTERKKNQIRQSRVTGTRNLIEGLVGCERIPEVMISASAVGYYGDCGEAKITESNPPTNDFLGQVCQAWEQEANRLATHGTRIVNLRIGIVLDKNGGALKEMLPIFRLGLGGRLGSGQQWFPWIQLDDLVALIEFCLDHPIHGPVNATAPNPVRNREFTERLAQQLGRIAFLPAPGFALKLALGEFANSLLSSQRVVPDKALAAGFEFQFPELSGALRASLS